MVRGRQEKMEKKRLGKQNKITEATDRDIKYILDKSHSAVEVDTYLEENGFRNIANGQYSFIHLKKGYKRVVKLGFYDRGSLGWKYMEYCKKNARKDPYLPKVYYMRHFKEDQSFAGVIELLHPYDPSSLDEYEKYILYTMCPISFAVDLEKNKPRARDTEHPLWTSIKNIMIHFRLVRKDLDINSSNVMIRPRTKHLVLTDPIVG